MVDEDIVGGTPDPIPNSEAKPVRPMVAEEKQKSKCKKQKC
jgi:hypothetical protein